MSKSNFGDIDLSKPIQVEEFNPNQYYEDVDNSTQDIEVPLEDDKPIEETPKSKKKVKEEEPRFNIEKEELNFNKEEIDSAPVNKKDNNSGGGFTPDLLFKAWIEDGRVPEDFVNIDEFGKADKDSQLKTLMELPDKLADARLNSYFESLPEDARLVLDNLIQGVPLDDILKIKSNVENFSKITEEDLKDDAIARKVITKKLELDGYSKEEIEDEIDSIIDYKKVATNHLKKVKQYETKELENISKSKQVEAETRQKRAEEFRNNLKNLVDNTKEVIPGMEITKNERNKLNDYMFNLKDNKSPLQRLYDKNPAEAEFKINYMLWLTKDLSDFSQVNAKAKTSAYQELSQKIKGEDMKHFSKSGNIVDEEKVDYAKSLGSFLKNYNK